jgi:hypothetical protein
VSDDLAERVALLEARIDKLEKKRGKGGRPAKKILVSAVGVCGLDPSRDSSTCEDANLYRRRQGCQGTACVSKAAAYYTEYRNAE